MSRVIVHIGNADLARGAGRPVQFSGGGSACATTVIMRFDTGPTP